ncbi:hypothetical protein RJT34_32845 [Clitoria ternatea]|uniref:CCHC-type domain-containing protein n=1 Tax=Clitoria ternatea TaxID=43366 RepID=A0AAN9EWT7_CLITE
MGQTRRWILEMKDMRKRILLCKGLIRIGQQLGTMLKVDEATSIHSTRRFARIYVEVDLQNSLMPSFLVLGRRFLVEYEGLNLICFQCEKYGHHVEQCLKVKIIVSRGAGMRSDGENDTIVSKQIARLAETESRISGPTRMDSRFEQLMTKEKDVQTRDQSTMAILLDMRNMAENGKSHASHAREEVRTQTKGNCRGACAKRFPMIMKYLARTYKMGFIAILEPKISGEKVDLVTKRIGFLGVQKVDAVGFSGGIWCLWNGSSWAVDFIKASTQCIHLRIREGDNRAWLLSIVYAFPQPQTRVALWDELHNLATTWSLPWCLAEDFNLVLCEYEKEKGSMNESQLKNFDSCIEDCRLMEVNTSDPFFTLKKDEVNERLDRVLASSSWREYFPEATVTSLALPNLDHYRQYFYYQETDFKFQSMWKKKTLILRIEGIDSKLISQWNLFLTSLRHKLWIEYERILSLEERYWAQLAKVKWLQIGDRNTSYYHWIALIRRAREKI